MRKESYNLPNLSSVLKGHEGQLACLPRHRNSNNHGESTLTALSRKNHSHHDQILIKFIPEKPNPYRKNTQDILRVNKSYRLQITPAKRKYSDQSREDVHISKVIQLVSPTVDRYGKRAEAARDEILKQRMSKQLREGSKMTYKFKRSMLEVKKRKRQRDEYETSRSNVVREEARAQLQAIIQKSIHARLEEEEKDDPEAGLQSTTERKSVAEPIAHSLSAVKPTMNESLRIKTEDAKDYFLVKHREYVNKQVQAHHLHDLFDRYRKKNQIGKRIEDGNTEIASLVSEAAPISQKM